MKKFIIAFALLSFGLIHAQAQHTISGTIVDETGAPVIGANIMIFGTSNGTISDIDGNYTIDTDDKDGKLSFSFIGYKKHIEDIKGRSRINIFLIPDTELLNEIVAVGYNKVRKKDVTGAVAKIDSKDLVNGSVSNYDQALAGRVAGVQVSAVDGTPGAAMNVVIRGGNSITGENSPLYVVDGLAIEDFDPGSISSHDIQEFDILKDASATAIYGSRGANGVVIITTKEGNKEGRTSVSFNASVGVQEIKNRIEVMNPYEYVLYEQEVANNKGGSSITEFNEYWIDPLLYTEEALAERGESATSWQDEIFRAATVQNYNLSVNGGNKTSNIYYSLDYMDQEGTLINTGYNRINNNLKFSHRINPEAQVGAYLSYSYINRNGQDVSGNNRHSVIKNAVTYRPVNPIVDDGRDGGIDYDTNPNDLRFNPVKTLNNTEQTKRQDFVRGNTYLNYNFSKALKIKVSAAYQLDNRKESLFYGEDTYQGTVGIDGINATVTDRRYQTLSTSEVLTYKKSLNDIHNFTALAGFEAQYKTYDYFSVKSTNMPTDEFGSDKLGIGTGTSIPSSSSSISSLVSFFGSLNYAYNEKYLLTVNFRTDGSSKFTAQNRWGYFPSFSAAWRLSEEDFIKNLNLFSNLKLRAGYGITGNNRIADYVAYSQLDVSTESGYVIDGEYYPGIYHSNLASSDLRWETTKQTNIGLDMGFFNNRISTVVDYYKKNTTDLLLYAEMAPSVGYEQVYQNVGEVQNQGLEFAINTVNIDTRNFTWSSSFNISFNKNKTIALNSGQTEMLTNPDWYFSYDEYQYITKVGAPVGMFYGLRSDGVYQMDDFNYNTNTGVYSLKDGIPDNGGSVAPGSIKYKDLNNDGTINEEDRTTIGNPHPKHFGGLSNDLKYKNFDLSFFFQWSYGNSILNANNVEFENPTNSSGYNYAASVADRWTPTNASNEIHTIIYNNVYGTPPDGNYVSDAYLEDGSYLRLKNISIGYTLGDKLINRLKLEQCRIYISAQNLYTWTNYSGYDPEVSVGKYGALTPGLDYSAYPTSSSYIAGIQVKF